MERTEDDPPDQRGGGFGQDRARGRRVGGTATVHGTAVKVYGHASARSHSYSTSVCLGSS